MFDVRSYRGPVPVGGMDAKEDDDDRFARRCREPAEQWVLARRANRPWAMRHSLPRVVTA